MATKNPRINVVLDDEMYQAIQRLARRDKVSLSQKIKEFTRHSLEELEDHYLSKIADERSKTFRKKSVLRHQDVFK